MIISCKNASRGGVLREVSIRQLGGKAFLVGNCLNDDNQGNQNPFGGVTTWLAMDDITQIMEFKTADDVKNAYKAWGEAKKEAAVP